jgi:hypothetical protein
MNEAIYKTFIYETMNGEFMVTDPMEFDSVVPGGPFETEAQAREALERYVETNQIVFEQ